MFSFASNFEDEQLRVDHFATVLDAQVFPADVGHANRLKTMVMVH